MYEEHRGRVGTSKKAFPRKQKYNGLHGMGNGRRVTVYNILKLDVFEPRDRFRSLIRAFVIMLLLYPEQSKGALFYGEVILPPPTPCRKLFGREVLPSPNSNVQKRQYCTVIKFRIIRKLFFLIDIK